MGRSFSRVVHTRFVPSGQSEAGSSVADVRRGIIRVCASRVVLAPVTLYQRLVSPTLPRRCRYEPTCSAYAVRAVLEYGILRGLVLAAWRLLRCNPWSHGGYDPVAAQRLFAVRRDAVARTGVGVHAVKRDTGARTNAGAHRC